MSRRELGFLLVMLQAGIALVTGLTTLLVTIAAPGFRGEAVLTAIELGIAVGLLSLGFGALGGRPRAVGWLIRFELLCLLTAYWFAVAGLGQNRDLAPLLTNLGLPLAVILLLASGPQAVRRVTPAPGAGRVIGGRWLRLRGGAWGLAGARRGRPAHRPAEPTPAAAEPA